MTRSSEEERGREGYSISKLGKVKSDREKVDRICPDGCN